MAKLCDQTAEDSGMPTYKSLPAIFRSSICTYVIRPLMYDLQASLQRPRLDLQTQDRQEFELTDSSWQTPQSSCGMAGCIPLDQLSLFRGAALILFESPAGFQVMQQSYTKR